MNVSRHLKGLAYEWVDRVVPVKPVVRSELEQQQIDHEARRMQLYYCPQCPDSITVKRRCQKLGLRVVEKDVERVNAYRNELVNGGGAPRVPCLRIDDGDQSSWLYSLDSILGYLEKRF